MREGSVAPIANGYRLREKPYYYYKRVPFVLAITVNGSIKHIPIEGPPRTRMISLEEPPSSDTGRT